MNARELQQAVKDDLTALFQNIRYKTPEDEKAAVSVFEQNLPMRQTEDADDPFPYIIVRLDSGGIATQTDPHKVAVILLIGCYDDNPDNQGHKSVLEILEKIQNHYEETPLLAGQFVFRDPFNWALQDEESYPYYCGAANLTFDLPATRRKWSELV